MLFSNPAAADPPDIATNAAQIASIKARMDATIQRVQQIVNRPVTELRRTPDMHVVTYPGWFDPGAIKPNFRAVDVRKTQVFPYSQYQYVTSDLNPGVVFFGSELEFNSMTKYFYTDRSVPKKRLTEAQMEEINQLYQTIGKCEHQLFELEHPNDIDTPETSQDTNEAPVPQPPLAIVHRWIFTHKPLAGSAVGALLIILIVIRRLRPRPEN